MWKTKRIRKQASLLYWCPVLGTALIIGCAILSANFGWANPITTTVQQWPYGDKIGHFVLMGALSFFVNLALGARTFLIGKRSIMIGSAIVFALVLFEEVSQIWIPRRTFSWLDLAADVCGIVLFGKLAAVICKVSLRNDPRQL